MPKKVQVAVPVNRVRVEDGFWTPVQSLVLNRVIPHQADILEDKVPGVAKSHAVENFRIAAGEAKGEFYGMVFQDSDLAKWLEAAAYSLALRPDPGLEQKADEWIALIGRAQREDGYLNTYFLVKEPGREWQNLKDCHELYCAGHMIEAAVAYYQATGKDKFLNIMRKNADLICARFGPGKQRGIPGHQEIELALLRLYRATGEQSYLNTARYFLEERGSEPSFFAQEAQKRNWAHWSNEENREYAQNHAPVKQQSRAVGHSVRAVYMYTAMADMAAETGDEELMASCRRLWDNICQKQLYVTGGIGATVEGEAFGQDYDLPNDVVYAETCASVAMVFFARRMLEACPKGEYADVMEQELYNGVLSGMQLDGKRFFYVNPLEVVPGVSGVRHGHKHVLPQRPGWYACACCPPNVARLLASLGQYAWGESGDGIFAHTYLGGQAELACAGGVDVVCESAYPWQGRVKYVLNPKRDGAQFFFAIHLPGWCGNWALEINGQRATPKVKNGYAYLSRAWSVGDVVELSLALEPRRIYANTRVRANAGCVALARGPVVYCLEQADNGGQLSALRLPRSAEIKALPMADAALGAVVALEAQGLRLAGGQALYSETPPLEEATALRAIPYYAWGNRGEGEMRVWIQERE